MMKGFFRPPSTSYALSTTMEWSCAVPITLKRDSAHEYETNKNVQTMKATNMLFAFTLSGIYPPL
jgi:hypothetical protein